MHSHHRLSLVSPGHPRSAAGGGGRAHLGNLCQSGEDLPVPLPMCGPAPVSQSGPGAYLTCAEVQVQVADLRVERKTI